MRNESFDYGVCLCSREWALKKEAVRERCSGVCEYCGVGDFYTAHHLTYERIGHELLADLLGVCRECHSYLSAKSHTDPRTAPVVIQVEDLDSSQTWTLLFKSRNEARREVEPLLKSKLETIHITVIPKAA